MASITNIAALEELLGPKIPQLDLKVIDYIDPHGRKWIDHSTLMFAGISGADNALPLNIVAASGKAGFADGDEKTITIPLSAFHNRDALHINARIGSLFFVPGMKETFRFNGRVAQISDKSAIILVEEAYLHCAKSLMRSDFWDAEPCQAPDDIAEFTAQSRFLLLATINEKGQADLSPKGDPAGLMAHIKGETLLFPDRPGNKRVDSFRNIMEQPQISGALLIPGAQKMAVFSGTASLSTAEEDRTPFAVKGKVPHMVTKVDNLKIAMENAGFLGNASLWPPAEKPCDIKAAQIFADHIRIGKDKKANPSEEDAMFTDPNVIQHALDDDYANNVY